MTRLSILLFSCLYLAVTAKAQNNVGINDNNSSPEASAMLDIYSTTKGLLVPRVALTGTGSAYPVISPAISLLVYNTATTSDVMPGYYYWDGSKWLSMVSDASSYWSKSGNNIYNNNSGNVGIGTGSPASLLSVGASSPFQVSSTGDLVKIRGVTYSWPTSVTNNYYLKTTAAGVLSWAAVAAVPSLTSGSVVFSGGSTTLSQDNTNFYWDNTSGKKTLGIGTKIFTAAYPEKLKVDAGATGNSNYQNVIVGLGNTNNYAQLNLKNQNAGGSASSDVVATADNGNETTNYIDMGINSSTYNDANYTISGANDAYLYNVGQDMIIGTATPAKSLLLMTGGTMIENERLRIDGTGNVGIGNSSPESLLSVGSSSQFQVGSMGDLVKINNVATSWPSSQGAASTFLQNNGSGTLSWAAVSGGTVTSVAAGDGMDFTTITGSGSVIMGTPSTIDSTTSNGVSTGTHTHELGVIGITKGGTGAITRTAAFNNLAPAQTTNSGKYLTTDGTNASWAAGGLIPSLTSGSVIFSGGSTTLSEDNDNFYWDITNKQLGIGTKTFDATNPEKLLVDAGVTESVNAIYAKGTINNYLQTNIQNLSDGDNASTDIVATADNGTETTNYIDMGINGSGYIYDSLNPISSGLPNDTYIYSAGNDFHLINNNPDKDMLFLTGGAAIENERMRITNFGKVGIGTGKPTARLHIIGQLDEPQFKVQSYIDQTNDIMQLWDPDASTKYVTVDNLGRMIIGGPGAAVGSNNLLTVNSSTHTPEASAFNTLVEFDSEDGEKSDFVMRLSGDNGYPRIVLKRSTGDLSSPANVSLSQPDLGALYFKGYCGSSWSWLSGVIAQYTGDGTTKKADLQFQTANGDASPVTRIYISAPGNVGIGSTDPGNKLEINQGATGNSGLRFTQLRSSSTPSSANGSVLSVNADGDVILTPNTAVSTPLSGLTPAMGTNTIDNLNLAQAWNWSTAATENPMAFSANALTSGNLLSLSTSNTGHTGSLFQVTDASTGSVSNGLVRFNFSGAHTGNGFQVNDATLTGNAASITGNSLTTGTLLDVTSSSVNGNSANGLLRVANTSSDTSGIIFRAQSNSTSGSGLTVKGTGTVGIGSGIFDHDNPEKLLIDAGTTMSVNAIYARGTINNYFQTNIRNLSNGTQASSDIVATADNGTETTNFMDMGINGSGYVYQAGNPIETGKANDCYVLGSGNDLYFVNNNAAKDMIFMVAGTAPTNEAMRITSAKRVGIGTTSPASLFSAGANSEFQVNSTGNMVKLNNVVTSWPSSQGAAASFLRNDGSGNLTWVTGTGGASLSGLTPATGTNTIDNLNFAQAWNWSTATTQNPMTFSANGLTTGNLFSLSTTNTGHTGTLFQVTDASTGTSANGLARFNFTGAHTGNGFQVNDATLTGNAGAIIGNSITTGTLLDISSSYASGNSTNGLFRVANTGAGTNGIIFRAQANSTAGSGMTVKADGTVGIGTTTTNNKLEINQGTPGYSGLRFTQMTSVSTPSASNAVVLSVNANGDVIITPNTTISVPLSGLTFATGTNTIDNLNFAQAWNWSTANTHNPMAISANVLTSGNLFSLSTTNTGHTGTLFQVSDASTSASTNGLVRFNFSGAHTGNGFQINDATLTGNAGAIIGNSLTTGTLLDISSSYASGNSTNGLFRVANTGAGTNGIIFRAQSNSTSGSGLTVKADGNVGIGSGTFDATNPEKLLVDAGTTTSVNAIYAKGTINSYFQTNIRNLSNGAQASSDIVATADNGTETTNFMNMGINGSGYVYQSGNPIETGKANDCYVLGSGNDLYLVNNNAAKDMIFLVAGTASTNEAMRITSAKRLGIGTTAPSNTLSVGANSEFQVNSTGNIARINNVATSWPSSQGSAATFLRNDGSGNLAWVAGIGGASLSGLTAATATNTIDNLNYAQAWNWSTATTQNPMTFSANALTTGTLMDITSSYASGNSTNGLFRVANTGAATNGIIFRAQSNSTAGSGMTVKADGSVGIGTTTTTNKLDVAGNVGISSVGAPSVLTIDAHSSTTNIAKLSFINSYGTGDFQIGGDGGDIFWQGGGGRNLQMGAWHGMDLAGARLSATPMAFMSGTNGNYNTRVINTTDAIGLIVQGNSTQTKNLQEWRNSSGTTLSVLTPSGSVGIGTSAPVSSLSVGANSEFQVNSTGNVARINNVATNWPSSQGAAATFLRNDGSGNLTWVAGTSTSLSALVAATGSNTIDNLNNAQAWNWSTATTQNPMSFSANALTSGNLFSLSSTNSGHTGTLLQVTDGSTSAATNGLVRFNFSGAHTGNGLQIDDATQTGTALDINGNSITTGSLIDISSTYASGNSTNGLFRVANTGAGTNGIIFRAQSNSTAGSGLTVKADGNTGIGTTTPAADLDVNGSMKLGPNCPVLSGIIKTSVSVTDNTSFDYNVTRTETVTITGAAVNATVIVNPRTALPTRLGIAYSYVSAANTVKINITNSGGAVALGTVVFDITVIQ